MGILVSNRKGARRQGSSKLTKLTRGQRLENQGLQAALKKNAQRQGTSKRIRFERGQRLDEQGLQAAITRIRRLSLFWDSAFFMGHISKISGCHIPLESFFRALSRGVSKN